MTLHLGSAAIRELCDPDLALQACRQVLDAERAGRARLPARLDVDVPTGFLRVMPAALGDHMGLKVMTLARGAGNRYLLLLYLQRTGELVAVLDADEITRLRTAATTVVAGELLHPAGTDRIGLIGTGFEAEGHLRAFAHAWRLRRVMVHGRSAERRTAFAERLSAETGVEVVPMDTAAKAVADAEVSVLCTKSTVPVVDGADFPSGAVVLSIGSTRLDLRELDSTALERSTVLLVDNAGQVRSESGDIAHGLSTGALSAERIVDMSAWDPARAVPDGGRDLRTFKSVGTALQDLALAVAVLERAHERGFGRELGELCALKASAPGAVVPSSVQSAVAGAASSVQEVRS